MRGLFVVLLCVGMAGLAKADPGPVVNWLINEPASLFDIGMMRLQKRVDDYIHMQTDERMKRFRMIVLYDWNTNRINIRGYIAGDNPVLLEERRRQFQVMCEVYFRNIRRLGAVDPKTGRHVDGNSYYSDLFAHSGYGSKEEPFKYMMRLDHIIMIEFRYPNSHPTLKPWSCTGPLLDSGFSIKEDVVE